MLTLEQRSEINRRNGQVAFDNLVLKLGSEEAAREEMRRRGRAGGLIGGLMNGWRQRVDRAWAL